MGKLTRVTEIRSWVDRDGSASMRSKTISGQPVIHMLNKEDWALVNAVIEALEGEANPVNAIKAAVKEHNEPAS